ncbi:Hypp7404 [Branchiostoma lanceolatum]|uniref:Hypp7404 protein n=1 Tax=Branchiostoma lanceolatum TaxID=7740 RepID=A0A8J9Z0I0_BRALA|nr:Hypp7404 [Branchiostoma lanceolatum]
MLESFADTNSSLNRLEVEVNLLNCPSHSVTMETQAYILVLIFLCGAVPQAFGGTLRDGAQPDAEDSSSSHRTGTGCAEPGGVCPGEAGSENGNNQDEPSGLLTAASSLNAIIDQIFLQLKTEMAARDRRLQQLQDEMKQIQSETTADSQMTQTEIQQLQTEMAARDERIQQQQDDIRQLQAERAATDQRIQALEQRNYIDRCESGVLSTPSNVLDSGTGTRYRDMTATFSKPFRTTPVVTIGFRVLDISHSKNTRVTSDPVWKPPLEEKCVTYSPVVSYGNDDSLKAELTQLKIAVEQLSQTRANGADGKST